MKDKVNLCYKHNDKFYCGATEVDDYHNCRFSSSNDGCNYEKNFLCNNFHANSTDSDYEYVINEEDVENG